MALENSVECQEATAFYSPTEANGSLLSAELAGLCVRVFEVHDEQAMLATLSRETPNSVLIDLTKDSDSGIAVLRSVRRENPDIGIVVMSSSERMESARSALAAGADDFMVEGLGADLVAATLRLVAATYRLRVENRNFVNALQVKGDNLCLTGYSPVIRRLQTAVERAAENNATILIEGMPGSGKTLVAGMIHELAVIEGRNTDLVVSHCEGLSESGLLAALSSGHKATLLLEDVDCLPPTAQAILVKHLKEKSVPENGAASGNVRIIATTSARLAELTAKGVFREDLYYRLNVFPLAMPSLKERKEDIACLAAHLLEQSSIHSGMPDHGFTPAAMILMETHPWPGNISQLKSAILRAHALAAKGPIDRVHLLGPVTGICVPPGVAGLSDSPESGQQEFSETDILPFQEEEKRILGRALVATKGNVRRAAQLLGIGRATLYRKIQIYDLRLQ